MTTEAEFIDLRVSVTDKLDVTSTKPVGEGYLAVRAQVARSGVYQYTRREIGMTDGNPNELVGVYRSPEFTFDEKSLATIAHKPVTLNHPPKGVSAKSWKRDAVGHSGGAVSEADDRKHVVVDMLLMDHSGVEAAQTTHKQISLGYATDIKFENGVSPDGEEYVAMMDGGYVCDHIALVPAGRAGHTCRIGDAAWPVEDSTVPPKKETPRVKTFNLDGLPVRYDDEAALDAAFAKLQARIGDAESATATALTDKAAAEAAVATAAVAHVTAIEAKDAEIATLTATNATLTTELADARDPAKLRDAAAEYGATVAKAKALGATVTDADSIATVKRNAVNAKLGDVAKDWTDAQVDVSFATLTASVADAKPDAFRDAMANRDVVDFADAAAKAKTAREKMIAEMTAPRGEAK